MADQKKIIKVDDLIIQAENVYFEPVVREARPVHPLFGPRPARVEQPQPELDSEENTDEEEKAETTEEPESERQPNRRPPFSWL
ncbi:MAG TPA: hypothetical protein GXZ58_03560 [Bacilli bacterium]|uniref:Uncharacterized protein n=1 Tax=Amphibacillus indicireducens TaxID=1076330 RepID=A0ABP7V1Q1_9BACI|nr:hypothetical protein [Bacilli bacterium]